MSRVTEDVGAALALERRQVTGAAEHIELVLRLVGGVPAVEKLAGNDREGEKRRRFGDDDEVDARNVEQVLEGDDQLGPPAGRQPPVANRAHTNIEIGFDLRPSIAPGAGTLDEVVLTTTEYVDIRKLEVFRQFG